ncbi:MAG: hypothetical protein JWR04_4 [Rhodoglobus sp.]|nr:hypothetical protein [Rhodoglobus sp.]
MDLTGAGTAIMLAIAAGLWFLYLVPTWVRRREYLATERTATRLQQTMRILAETAEVPDAVRVAATARDAARAERVLRAQQRRADAMVARQVRAERAATPSAALPRMLATHTTDALRRRRMRRTRMLASLLMVVATILGLVQIWLMTTTGVTTGSWLVLAGTLGASGIAVATQRRLDVRAMPRAAVPVARPARSRIPAALYEGHPMRPVDPAPWTPVPVPQPLYRSRPAPQRVASALPRVPEVEARPAAPVTPMRADPPAARVKTGFAAMGIIDPADTAAPDLDEVLRRRRTAG